MKINIYLGDSGSMPYQWVNIHEEKNIKDHYAHEIITAEISGRWRNVLTFYLRFSADNVDHNIITIDGWNTFHGMGMIAMVTPGSKSSFHILISQYQ